MKPEDFGAYYESILENEVRKEGGIYYTPPFIVDRSFFSGKFASERQVKKTYPHIFFYAFSLLLSRDLSLSPTHVFCFAALMAKRYEAAL